MKLPNRLHSFAPYFLAMIGYYASTHLALAVPTLPNVNTNNVITITNSPYNATNDTTDNTTAIQNAINTAATGGNTNGLYGGTVRIPAPGTPAAFLCGPLTFKNNVNLQIDAGATLALLPYGTYPGGTSPPDFITCSSITNVEISGSGTIDGQATASDWWNGLSTSQRPYMISFSKCQRVLIQNVTMQNPPKMHMAFKSGGGNITIQGITINTPGTSPNTDGMDLVGTNCLIQNCSSSTGDDNIALGTSSAGVPSANIVVTNCAFGVGHGVSIGSNTAGGVSNLTVINCTFNGTDYGIRMKSNDNTSGGSGEGGIAQNLSYLNIGMTNIVDGAIVIYSYYASGGQFGTPTSVTPHFASTQAVASATIPVWRNITISNMNATVAGGGVPGIIWASMELPATNILLSYVNITASKSRSEEHTSE